MLFENKKTGEIKDWDFGSWYQTILNPENKEKYECKLNDFIDRAVKFREEWEDAPEEAIQVHIEGIQKVYMDGCGRVFIEYATAEEAEKAVRKLKAFKRLKDKGFRPKMWEWEYIYDDNISGELIIKAHIDDATDSDGKYTKDLDLLFCPEENI